jgi:hypothetical protein
MQVHWLATSPFWILWGSAAALVGAASAVRRLEVERQRVKIAAAVDGAELAAVAAEHRAAIAQRALNETVKVIHKADAGPFARWGPLAVQLRRALGDDNVDGR